jgi:hypothetical protein
MPVAPIYIISALLFLGAVPLPYGYYMLLRIAACGFFIWAAVITYERQSQYLPWVFGLLALLFNPIVKIHLPKELWAAIDIASAIFILVVRQKLLRPEREST